MPNETWQSDFTHYPLVDTTRFPKGLEIITWLDGCTRYARHVSTLTDNGMVYTVRLAGHGRQGGRNDFEQQLHDWNVVQKNSRPNHPTTCGKVERFQQTMKNWLRARRDQPSTLVELQILLQRFRTEYNTTRPHRSLPHRATPATPHHAMPKALPGPSCDAETHDRVRHDRVDKSGTVTLRVHGQSSTPSPANCSANSPSIRARTTSHEPRHKKHPNPRFRGSGCRRCPETSQGRADRI